MSRPVFPLRHFAGPALAAVLVAGLLLIGCDPSVTVVQPSDQYQFSLFGTLSVTADTQVIRVEPLGDETRIGAPPEIDAAVVLENLDTGTQVSLADSFESVGGGIAQVHNFRTTYPIEPGTQYRVAVRVDGETVTSATTTTPAQPPTLLHDPDSTTDKPFLLPCDLDFQGNPTERSNTFTLRATGVEHIAAVNVIYPVELPGPASSLLTQFDHYDDVAYDSLDNVHSISVFYGRDLLAILSQQQGCPSRDQFRQPYAVVDVTAGGPNWPDWRGASLNDLARPDTFSNVTGGHGFVGGIHSDTIRIPIRSRN